MKEPILLTWEPNLGGNLCPPNKNGSPKLPPNIIRALGISKENPALLGIRLGFPSPKSWLGKFLGEPTNKSPIILDNPPNPIIHLMG